MGKHQVSRREIGEILGLSVVAVPHTLKRAGVEPIRPSTGGSNLALYDRAVIMEFKHAREKERARLKVKPANVPMKAGRLAGNRPEIMRQFHTRIPVSEIAKQYNVSRQWMYELIKSWMV